MEPPAESRSRLRLCGSGGQARRSATSSKHAPTSTGARRKEGNEWRRKGEGKSKEEKNQEGPATAILAARRASDGQLRRRRRQEAGGEVAAAGRRGSHPSRPTDDAGACVPAALLVWQFLYRFTYFSCIFQSISKSFSKIYSPNYHLESHLSENRFSYLCLFQQLFYILFVV